MSKARKLAALGNAYSDGALSNRNLIINGAMQVAQRGTSGTTTSGGYYTVDRWANYTSAGAILMEQSTDAPSGFTHSLKNTMTTASSGAVWIVQQHIEGFNASQLSFGSSDAKDITLSFWVKSSVTGVFAGHLSNNNAGGSYRVLVFNYTITSANTWEYKTVNISGDTTGTWSADHNTGLKVLFNLGTGGSTATVNTWQTVDAVRTTGSVGIEGTTNATWQITGVQLEVGDTATPFEHRSYGQELALCQRYFERFSYPIGENKAVALGHWYDAAGVHAAFYYSEKRVAPTASVSHPNHFGVFVGTNLSGNYATVLNLVQLTTKCLNLNPSTLVSGSVGTVNAATLIAKLAASDGWIDIDAEL